MNPDPPVKSTFMTYTEPDGTRSPMEPRAGMAEPSPPGLETPPPCFEVGSGRQTRDSAPRSPMPNRLYTYYNRRDRAHPRSRLLNDRSLEGGSASRPSGSRPR